MEKIKRYLSFIMAFFILLTSIPVYAVNQNENPNDIKNHWAENPIRWAYDKGYLSGYPDGSFRPEENMTNAEYISLIVRILNGNKDLHTGNSNNEMWYSKFVAKAVEIGAIGKIENFKPDSKITRDEAFRLLAFAYSIKGDPISLDEFKDKDQVANKEAMAGLLERKIVSGYPDNTVKPKNPITRAEIASIVYRGEEEAKLTKIDISKNNTTKDEISKDTKKSSSSDYPYFINPWFNYSRPDVDDHSQEDKKKPEEENNEDNHDVTKPEEKDEKSELLKKLQELINNAPNVMASDKYKDSDSKKQKAYDDSIEEAKNIDENNSVDEIKAAIEKIKNSLKALKPSEEHIQQAAKSAIEEAKKDDKEIDSEEELDRKLNESRIQIDDLDGDYSIIALDKNLTVKGRVISDEDVVEVGATIVTVDKETQLDGENIALNGKEFTFDFSNLTPGSNKVNVYAYLVDGTLLEKVIFVETLTTKLTSKIEPIFIEDTDNSNEETLNDITVFNSKSDEDVKYIGVLNGSKTSESISKTNIGEKPVLFIRVGTYIARQLDSIVTEDDVRNDIEESENNEFLPNTTYYKTSSVEFEDLISEDEINLFFSGFDNSYEPEMVFNGNLSEELEKFVKDNNLDV